MKHRTRNMLVALTASCLLAVAGISGTVSAHGPGFGPGHTPDPAKTFKPLPSGWTFPTFPTHVDKSHQPDPDKSKKPVLDCTPVPVASATPVSTVAPGAAAKTNANPGFHFGWGQMLFPFHRGFDGRWLDNDDQKVFCSVDALRAVLDKGITRRIKSLQFVIAGIGKSALSPTDQATVDAEINSLITDLQALKTQVDAETTLAALQADQATFNTEGQVFRTVTLWSRLILGSEKLIASEVKLQALLTKLTTDVAAAPAGPEKDQAQLLLTGAQGALTDGTTLLAPLPAQLLAITPAQLADGSAAATLTSVRMAYGHASWDFRTVRWSYFWAEEILEHVLATPAPTGTPAPTATPAPTDTPAPTATPV